MPYYREIPQGPARRGNPSISEGPTPPFLTSRALLSVILLLIVPVLSGAAGSKLPRMPWACITVAGESHAVRLADSDRLRAAGFQHVPEQTAHGEAIYFVYDPPRRPSFHMRNVAVPLTLAWITPDNRVLDVIGMEPDSSGHRPSERVRGALELAPRHPLIGRMKADVRISPPRGRAHAQARPDC